MALQRCPEVPPSAGRWDVGFCRCSSERSMWSVAAECTLRCYSKVRARRKMHRGASAVASCIKTLVFPACSLCSCCSEAPEAAGGTGLSPLKPPAQAAAASAAVGADARQTRSGSEQRQRVQAVGAKTASPNIENKAGIVSRQPARPVARSASLPEREQRLVLLRPGPFPTPDAGKASLHAGPIAGNLGRRARQRPSK